MNEIACCPCGPTDVAIMEGSGFKKGFTMHDWCEKFYRGRLLEDGTIEPCPCKEHRK